jgi:putative transposase
MKRQSFNDPNHAHYLTFSCYRRRQLLTDDRVITWFLQSIDQAREQHAFRLLAWVVMPEHAHLLLHPKDEVYSISRIAQSIKGPFAHRVVAEWRENDPHKLKRLRVDSGDQVSYRFWQEGGGFDRNISQMDRIRKAIEYIEYNPVRRGLVAEASEWRWSSAYARAGKSDALLTLDEIEFEDERTGKGA